MAGTPERSSMISHPRETIGLVAHYLDLYDRTDPQVRPGIEAFYAKVKSRLAQLDFSWTFSPICCVRAEFDHAVEQFVKDGVVAVVSIHLAYSPSLESIEAFARLNVPIVILDTTPAARFDADTSPDEIMFNHGIHGVQDFCNRLRRSGLTYFVEAGHLDSSSVITRVEARIKGVAAAARLKKARVGLVGRPFPGMGDFQVPDHWLKDLGITVVSYTPEDAAQARQTVTREKVAEEMASLQLEWQLSDQPTDLIQAAAQAGLNLRTWLEDRQLDAVSLDFLDLDVATGWPTLPAIEIDRAMAEGTGYAGEGDVLTAALGFALAPLASAWTFTEMFCPDWDGQRIYLSHMAEANLDILAGKLRVSRMPFPIGDTIDPLVVNGYYQPGHVCLVNLAPQPDGHFALLVVPGDLEPSPEPNRLAETVHGWFKPEGLALEDFFARYSEAGGTHHAVLLYGDPYKALDTFGQVLGFKVIRLGGI